MATFILEEQPGISPSESFELGIEMADAFIATLEGLDGSGWKTMTRCAPWTVQDITAHLIGWAEALTSFRELGSQARRSLARVKEFGNVVDAQNSVQVDDRKYLASEKILERVNGDATRVKAWLAAGVPV